jgi:hypothetical protein
LDEFRYVFHLCYHLLSCISDLDLVKKPFIVGDKDNSYGSLLEYELIKKCFKEGIGLKQLVELYPVTRELGGLGDIKKFIDIFEHGKVGGRKAEKDLLSYD